MEQFSRSALLIGEQAISQLQQAHVAVFGLGGVGSYTAEALARAGVGTLTLIDHDTISVTNLNRQLYALHSTVGQPKAEVAAQRIRDINPRCHVIPLQEFYLPENAEQLLSKDFDYVIDAIDTVSAKIDLACRCSEMGVPIISCMGTGNKLDAARFRVEDISRTSMCPLCRVMRRELKKRGLEHLKVVYSDEPPITPAPTDEKTEKRQVPGSMSFVPPVAGMILAGEAIKDMIRTKNSNTKERQI